MTERARLVSRLSRALSASNDYRTSQRDRHEAARRAAALAERLGLIDRPKVCQACFHARTLFRHHPDNSAPLRIQYLCRGRHREADRVQANLRKRGA